MKKMPLSLEKMLQQPLGCTEEDFNASCGTNRRKIATGKKINPKVIIFQ